MIYALCTRKNEYTYDAIWDCLKENNPGLNIKHMMFDFEMAALNAARNAFPEAQIHACIFHLGKNIFKQIVSSGLRTKYVNDDDFAHKMRMIGALVFVPLNKVKVFFHSNRRNYFHQRFSGCHRF